MKKVNSSVFDSIKNNKRPKSKFAEAALAMKIGEVLEIPISEYNLKTKPSVYFSGSVSRHGIKISTRSNKDFIYIKRIK